MYAKDGRVTREEQAAAYPQIHPRIPDANPRGCNKGIVHSKQMVQPDRLLHPLKRVGRRGEGKWERVGWEAAMADIAARALGTVERWGFYAMLYTGLYFGRDNLYMTGAALKKYDVWLAAYRSKKPTPGWPFGLWQYTSKGKIPGVVDAIPGKISGVDLSVPYKDYAKIIAKKGLTRLREGK